MQKKPETFVSGFLFFVQSQKTLYVAILLHKENQVHKSTQNSSQRYLSMMVVMSFVMVTMMMVHQENIIDYSSTSQKYQKAN